MAVADGGEVLDFRSTQTINTNNVRSSSFQTSGIWWLTFFFQTTFIFNLRCTLQRSVKEHRAMMGQVGESCAPLFLKGLSRDCLTLTADDVDFMRFYGDINLAAVI